MDLEKSHIQTLTQELHKSEDELRSLAVDVGLRLLWRERVLALRLRGKILREQAIGEIGLDRVSLAEQQHQAMQEDLAWAMQQVPLR